MELRPLPERRLRRHGDTPPLIAPLKPIQVKWILPPSGSTFYALDKAFAEGAGYETVANDDLSCPRR